LPFLNLRLPMARYHSLHFLSDTGAFLLLAFRICLFVLARLHLWILYYHILFGYIVVGLFITIYLHLYLLFMAFIFYIDDVYVYLSHVLLYGLLYIFIPFYKLPIFIVHSILYMCISYNFEVLYGPQYCCGIFHCLRCVPLVFNCVYSSEGCVALQYCCGLFHCLSILYMWISYNFEVLYGPQYCCGMFHCLRCVPLVFNCVY